MTPTKLLFTLLFGMVLFLGPSLISTLSIQSQGALVVHDTIYIEKVTKTKCDTIYIENVTETHRHNKSQWHNLSRTTVYNPTTSQCDDSPLTTADCSKIDLVKLKNNSLRWVALSRDLLTKFPHGSKIELFISDNHPRNGVYEVHDTMNKRYSNTLDILTYNDTHGKWSNAKIRKI